MDEEELEMVLYCFLFLRKKNVLKKGGSGLDLFFRKEKDLQNITNCLWS